MATFDNITAESFAKEILGGGRKRRRCREALSCLQCRQKKIKVIRCFLHLLRIPLSDQNGSVTDIDRAISAKRKRLDPNVPIPKQVLSVHFKARPPA
jgi:hypothetical protein